MYITNKLRPDIYSEHLNSGLSLCYINELESITMPTKKMHWQRSFVYNSIAFRLYFGPRGCETLRTWSRDVVVPSPARNTAASSKLARNDLFSDGGVTILWKYRDKFVRCANMPEEICRRLVSISLNSSLNFIA